MAVLSKMNTSIVPVDEHGDVDEDSILTFTLIIDPDEKGATVQVGDHVYDVQDFIDLGSMYDRML